MREEKFLVPLCRDHFIRLATNSTCEFCPSKLVNEKVVKKMAELYQDDNSNAVNALMNEIYSIRQSQQELSKDIEAVQNLEKEITKLGVLMIGVDGRNGLRSKIENEINDRKFLATEIDSIKKEVESAKRLIYIGVGIVATLSVIIPFIIKAIN